MCHTEIVNPNCTQTFESIITLIKEHIIKCLSRNFTESACISVCVCTNVSLASGWWDKNL